MPPKKKKIRYRNETDSTRTFDGYEEDFAGLFSLDKIKKFAKETGLSIVAAAKELKKAAGFSVGGMPHKRKNSDVPKGFHKMPDGSIMKDKKMSTAKDYRKGGMIINSTNNKRYN